MLIAIGILAAIILYSVYGVSDDVPLVTGLNPAYVPPPEQNPAPPYVPDPLLTIAPLANLDQSEFTLADAETFQNYINSFDQPFHFVPPPDNNPVPAVDSYNVNPPPDRLISPVSVSNPDHTYNINQE